MSKKSICFSLACMILFLWPGLTQLIVASFIYGFAIICLAKDSKGGSIKKIRFITMYIIAWTSLVDLIIGYSYGEVGPGAIIILFFFWTQTIIGLVYILRPYIPLGIVVGTIVGMYISDLYK